jgi:glycosyltransferase involved in cell wall biosynthesis
MMPRIWSLLDVALVHLKDQDTFREVIPSKIFEAMAMGLPLLLVAPVGEASAIIDKTQAGLNVLAGQPHALADAAKRMADDRALTSRLAATSLSSAPLYSRQTQAESMMAALELAIGSPR